MRPVLTTFRSLKLQHWGDQPHERRLSGAIETDNLFEASLNFWSLRYFDDSMGRYHQRTSTIQSS